MDKLNQPPDVRVPKVSGWSDQELSEKYSSGVKTQEYILRPGIVKEFLPTLNKDSVVLDLGCGNGYYTNLFARQIGEPQNVVGIDISDEQIKLAKSSNYGDLGPESFKVGEVNDEPSGKYSDVFANMVLCNISKQEVEKFIGDISRVLKVGGRFTMTNVHSDFQKTFSDSYMSHEYPKIDSGDKYLEGEDMKVKLKKEDGSEIGPFSNYHYSLEFLQETCEKFGLRLEQNVTLNTTRDTSDERVVKYSMFVFRKI
jgi:SAM-dependent methyltransferase